MQILDRTVRHQQAVLVLKIAGASARPVDHLTQHVQVVGMDSRCDALQANAKTRLKLKNPV